MKCNLPKYNVGQMVYLTTTDHIYTSYQNAIKYFRLEKYATQKIGDYLHFVYPNLKGLNNKWIITGIAYHGTFHDVSPMYALLNPKTRQAIITGEEGIRLCNKKMQERTKHIQEQNINYKISKIQ